jgi:uncharacterized protein DUF6338
MLTTFSQILILVAFIIPGFVLVRVKRLSFPSAEESFQTTLLDSLALTCIVHGLASPAWYWCYVSGIPTKRPVVFGFVVFAILFGIPVLLGLIYSLLVASGSARWLRGFLNIPEPLQTAWDYYFRQKPGCWVRVILKSGQVIAGLFGPSSFASSFPGKQDLYLEKLLSLDEDGMVTGWADYSAGALVKMEEVERLEFFEIEGTAI